MIQLNDSLLLGKGAHRACYRHPNDPNKCIKVLFKVTEKEKKSIDIEIDYYRHLQTFLKDWSGIPRFYGMEETNLGMGQVFGCVVNYDGSPAEILTDYVKRCETRECAAEIVQLLRNLRCYIVENHIVTYPLHGHNLLVHKVSESEKRLVICDNIGQRTFLKFAVWFKWVAVLRHNQQWRKFVKDAYMQDFIKKFSVNL